MGNHKQLFRNFLIFTAAAPDDLFKGSIRTEDGRITAVYREADNIPMADDCPVIEGNGRLLMPGLVNSHTHIYSAFARGMPISPFSPHSFRQLLEQLWWRLDKALTLEDIYYSGLIAGMDMLRNGITTFIDHHASPNAVSGSLEQLVETCVSRVGLRGIFCYETSDRDGGETALLGIEENLAAQQFHLEYPGRVASLFGLHASFTLSDQTLERCSEYALPIHIHVAEGEEDGAVHKKEFGMSAISRLDRFNLLREDSLLAHCLLVEEEDLKIIHDRNCHVVFNPQSNMNNGAGLPDFSRFSEKNILIQLGNDGYGFDLTRDMRTLLLSQHLIHKNPVAFGMKDLFDVVFRNNPEYASTLLGTKLGKIASGYRADFTVYDYTPPTPLTADNFMGHYYFSIMENCKPSDVYIDGKPLLRNHHFCTLDEERVFAECKRCCTDFWKRV